jgi:hypothetical protein
LADRRPVSQAAEGGDYIRGGGGVTVDASTVFRVLVAAALLSLVGLAVGLTVSTASYNSRQAKLRHDAVPVEVTVTSCVGIGSGIAQAVNYYTCQGTYSLNGHQYSGEIRGNRAPLPAGQRLEAVAVPNDPGLLSTVAALAGKRSGRESYAAPIVLAVATAAFGAGWASWEVRRRRSRVATARDDAAR